MTMHLMTLFLWQQPKALQIEIYRFDIKFVIWAYLDALTQIKSADNIREQAKFILLQFNGIDEVFCRDGGATPLQCPRISLIYATDRTHA